MHIVVEAPTDTDSRPADTAGIVLIRPVIGVIKSAGPDGINVRGLRAAIRARHSAAQQAIDDAVELASRIGAITITDGQRGARIHHWNQDPTDDQIQELTT